MQFNVAILHIASRDIKWYKYFEKQSGIILQIWPVTRPKAHQQQNGQIKGVYFTLKH